MADLQKDTAGQHVRFALVNRTTGLGLTGATVTTYRTLDDDIQVPVTGTVLELGNGQYCFHPSQADTNGDSVGYLFVAPNAVLVSANYWTVFGLAAAVLVRG